MLRIRESDLNCDYKLKILKGLPTVKTQKALEYRENYPTQETYQRTLMINKNQREFSDIDVHQQRGYFLASEASDLQYFLIIGHCGGKLRALNTAQLHPLLEFFPC